MALKKPTPPVTTGSVPNKAAAPGKSKGSSLASSFDETPAGASFTSWVPGNYQAVITKMQLLEPNDKGQAVQITYTGHEDESEPTVANKDMSQFYKIANADGSVGPGIGFLKRDLEILGHADVKFADLEDTLERITSEQPAVNVNVKKDATGKYTNAYLEGLVD